MRTDVKAHRTAMATVARRILEAEMPRLEGLRELVYLGSLLTDAESLASEMRLLRGIESELDDIPSERAGQYWEPEALARKERERDYYLALVADGIDEACRSILAKFGA